MGLFKRKKKPQAKEEKYANNFNDKDLDESAGNVAWIVDSLKKDNEARVKEVENLEAGPYGSESLAESVEKTTKFLNSIQLNNHSTHNEKIQLSLQVELAIKNSELEKAKVDKEIADIKQEILLKEEKSTLNLIELQITKLEANYKLIETAEKIMQSLNQEDRKEVKQIINSAKESIKMIKSKANVETFSTSKLPDEYQKEEDTKEKLKNEFAKRREALNKADVVSQYGVNDISENNYDKKRVDLQNIKRKEYTVKANRRIEIIKCNDEKNNKSKDENEKSI